MWNGGDDWYISMDRDTSDNYEKFQNILVDDKSFLGALKQSSFFLKNKGYSKILLILDDFIFFDISKDLIRLLNNVPSDYNYYRVTKIEYYLSLF